MFCHPVTKRAGGEGEVLVQDGAGHSRLPRYLALPFEKMKEKRGDEFQASLQNLARQTPLDVKT